VRRFDSTGALFLFFAGANAAAACTSPVAWPAFLAAALFLIAVAWARSTR